MVAIGDPGRQVEGEGQGAAAQMIVDVGRVGAVLHPHPLFQQGVGAGVGPHGDGAFKVKALQVVESFGFDQTARPMIGKERILLAVVDRRFIDLRQQ